MAARGAMRAGVVAFLSFSSFKIARNRYSAIQLASDEKEIRP
jgi:hypothetical protein